MSTPAAAHTSSLFSDDRGTQILYNVVFQKTASTKGTLLVFDRDANGKRSLNMRLVSLDGPHELDSFASAEVIERLSVTESSVVYTGKCGSSHGRTVELIFKFVPDQERLNAEAATYRQLAKLQGNIIPKFYGILQVVRSEVCCLVLERFGNNMGNRSFDRLSREDR